MVSGQGRANTESDDASGDVPDFGRRNMSWESMRRTDRNLWLSNRSKSATIGAANSPVKTVTLHQSFTLIFLNNRPTKMPDELILASQSPRRKELLTAAGYRFRVDAPSDAVEAGMCSRCSPQELVVQAAFLKAAVIAGRHESGIVLAADTVAVCGSESMGKPTDREHAKKMLSLMSGREHSVLTGVCLRIAGSQTMNTWLEETVLVMDELDDEALDNYLETDDWVGKAGAFGFQDGLDWVRIKRGLESNVIGLPIERLPQWFAEVGVEDLSAIKCSD